LKHFFITLVLAFLFASCSTKLQYAITTRLTQERFISRSELFSGNIPSGWFSSIDTVHGNSLDVWILRNDYSAAIAFRELNLDQKSKEIVLKEGLDFLAELSKSFSITDSSVMIRESKEFKIGENEFCSYELRSGTLVKRYVVFPVGNHFFECEATTLKGEWQQPSITELFTLQQSILASLQRKMDLP